MNTLSYKTKAANSQTVEKNWLLIDAEGQTLGRMASTIAYLLRGKHKPNFTPHVDCGDNIVVVNAEKLNMTGHKFTQKQYVRYTEYPGGQRITTPQELMARRPIKVLEKSVEGMLPKNRLGRQMFRNLYVYEGDKHNQQAQKPKKVKLEDFK